MNERIIALDIGDARIGVAVSDASRLIATPIDTIYRVGYGPDVRKVVKSCQRYVDAGAFRLAAEYGRHGGLPVRKGQSVLRTAGKSGAFGRLSG